MKPRRRPRIVVIYNRDFEGAESDPENKAREDVKNIAKDIIRVLGENGFETGEVAIRTDVHGALAEILSMRPNAVFNLCESILGDNRFEALIPLHLELAGIAFTGSCAFGLALALRKEKVKQILRASKIPVPRGELVHSVGECASLDLRFPAIVKPSREDASVGICSASVVRDQDSLCHRVDHVLEHYRQPALVEEFIEGREIYVSVLERSGSEPQVFPFFEIDFADMPADRPKIVSFEGKWVEDSLEYKGTRPVRCQGLSQELRTLVAKTALDAFRAIGLRDYGRIDFRLSAEGVPYVIDVNPNCDLSDLAGGYSRAAKAAGLSYKDLILQITELALARQSELITMSSPAPTAPSSSANESSVEAEDKEQTQTQRGGACSA